MFFSSLFVILSALENQRIKILKRQLKKSEKENQLNVIEFK